MGYYPRTDVYSDGYGLVLKIALPGFDSNNVQLAWSGSNLVVSGRHEERNSYARYSCKELYTGFFNRQYIINTSKFDLSKIKTNMNNGLLTVTIPYKNVPTGPQVKTININNKEVNNNGSE